MKAEKSRVHIDAVAAEYARRAESRSIPRNEGHRSTLEIVMASKEAVAKSKSAVKKAASK